MKRTCVHDLLQALDNSKTFYKYHKDINQIEVGDVTIVIQAVEDPTTIYGLNCLTSDTKVIIRRGGCVKKVRINKVHIGDEVITRKGWRPVSAVLDRGMKKVQKVKYGRHTVTCTADHRIFDVTSNSFVSASSLTNMSKCSTLSSEVNEWNRLNELQTRFSILTGFITTCRSQGIMNVHPTTARKVMEACTEMSTWLALVKYQKGISFITKTTIELITKLATLYVLKILRTDRTTGLTQKEKQDKERLQKSLLLTESMSADVKSVERLLSLALSVANIALTAVLKKQETKGTEKREFYSTLKNDVLSAVSSSIQKAEELCNSDSVPLSVRKQTREEETKNVMLQGDTKLTRKLVKFVENLLLHLEVARQPVLNTVPTLSVGRLSKKEKHVYDLSVEGEHEFYGNGILLHNCYAIYWDECDELPTETMMEAVRSLNERLRQQLIGERPPYAKWTTTSQGLKGLYQTTLQFNTNGIPYIIIRARTRDNKYLPPEYVQAMYAMYNEKEKECFLEGKFVSVDSGLVLPDYDPAKNDLAVDLFQSLEPNRYDNNGKLISKGDTVYLGQDFNGFGYACSAWVIKEGCLVCIKDYDFPDIRKAPEVFRYDFPYQELVWIPDMTYKEHFSEFKKELKQFNIHIAYRACNPLVTDRNFAINKAMKVGRLFVCPICTRVKHTLTTWQKDPKTGEPMKGGAGAPDHIGDTMGYVVHYLLTWKRELKDIYDLTLGRKYRYHDDPSARLGENNVTIEMAEKYIKRAKLEKRQEAELLA